MYFYLKLQIVIENKMQSENSITMHPLKPSININGHTSNQPPTRMKPMKRVENFSYCTDEQIGLGYSSKVYKGRNDLTNDLVAVKVIQLKESLDNFQKNLLKGEIKVMEKIMNFGQCEHLLKLAGVLKTKNNLYIVTQLCDGKDLGKLLRTKKYFNQPDAQTILSQIIQGYKQLNTLEIIHRDLKPANIFIKENKIKIADFGFAFMMEDCANQQNSEFNVGSSYYLAPEALKDNKYSTKSDIWAIGVIAYELVFGFQPWRNPVDKILYEAIQKEPIEELLKKNKDSQLLSQQYKTFIIQCLQFNPQHRIDIKNITKYHWPKAQISMKNSTQINSLKEFGKTQTSIQNNKCPNKNPRNSNLTTFSNERRRISMDMPQNQVNQSLQQKLRSAQKENVCQNINPLIHQQIEKLKSGILEKVSVPIHPASIGPHILSLQALIDYARLIELTLSLLTDFQVPNQIAFELSLKKEIFEVFNRFKDQLNTINLPHSLKKQLDDKIKPIIAEFPPIDYRQSNIVSAIRQTLQYLKSSESSQKTSEGIICYLYQVCLLYRQEAIERFAQRSQISRLVSILCKDPRIAVKAQSTNRKLEYLRI